MTIVWAFPKLPASQERGSRCGQGGWGGVGGQPAGEPSARGVGKGGGLQGGRVPQHHPRTSCLQEVGLVCAGAGWAPGRHGPASALGLCGAQARGLQGCRNRDLITSRACPSCWGGAGALGLPSGAQPAGSQPGADPEGGCLASPHFCPLLQGGGTCLSRPVGR